MIAGKKILFADDDVSFVTMYSRLMEKNGMKVITAATGDQAIEVAMKEKPDIIVLDIGMPGKDGLETTKILREDKEWGSKVPIIILTGKQPELDKVAEATPTYYFIKGDKSFEDFVSAVEDLLID